MPGRGESDWLADPNDYVFTTYLTTLIALIARSGAESVDWVGTSMGGLLGIVAAAQPKSPVARLVVNDVGPVIEPAALARIRGYFGARPDVRDLRRDRRVHAHGLRAVRAAHRCAMGASHAHQCPRNAPTAAGDSPTIPASRCRSARPPRRRTCGRRLGRDPLPDARAAGRRVRSSFRGHRQRRWRRADRDPRSSNSPDVGHAPMLLSPEQIDPGREFLRAEPPRPAPKRVPARRLRASVRGACRSAAIGRHRLQSRSPMVLTLSLPPLDPRPANPPETRPAKVGKWLDEMLTRNAIEAARVIGDALAATNRVAMSDARRLELAEKYWSTAASPVAAARAVLCAGGASAARRSAGGGQGVARPRPGALRRLQAPARARGQQAGRISAASGRS